ncbi:Acyl-CoA synthetase (AMP-forming)/AMP-acid ligase II [Neorhodopirellula lusitana]|uniref:Acyl-CoA synthetase (AMP-forming)/AMP-acid ligase II n=1 Tax=Neorhodopirellula lusitana TaxID=445327 RepID=A0ABY1Q263_9BACT|nr:AMP-binding protein [Neorhodopirellula lusitana]SMP53620.1 Acyl-CoA synthetase (AMP-forming)/AMP-acid ligase II [Neorhodopirellula lusitana]
MLRKSDQAEPSTCKWISLAHVLHERASVHPDRPALTFLSDGGNEETLTYAGLNNRVTELAARLNNNPTLDIQPGDRALLLFPPGLEFMVAFLACQYIRVVPVPTCFPKPGRAMPRLDSAATDCRPKLLLADAETLDGIDLKRLNNDVAAATFVATDATRPDTHRRNVEGTHSHDWTEDPSDSLQWNRLLDEIEPEDLGLLQYTSGSTSQPKGVMVSHANLISNLEAIRMAFGLEWTEDSGDQYSRGVFWLPPFHDMGLIGGILEAVYIGGHTVLMSPRSFLSRPLRWLETISKMNASISGAPNFAYQLCVDRIESDQVASLDLSKWNVAFCGAEPISAETLKRFSQHFAASGFTEGSFTPCYGLAESTLLAASGHGTSELPVLRVDRDDLLMGTVTPLDADSKSPARQIVACGQPGYDMTIEIVDPTERNRLSSLQVGEIWLQGTSVAGGYYQRPEVNAEQFQAKIAGEESRGEFLRTGDLGFVHDGQLYVTGRCKDVIILRGRNHYPQDIEATVASVLDENYFQSVALAMPGPHGDTLALVIEVIRHMDAEAMPEAVRHIRRQLIEEHEVDARQVILTRPGAIPLTTSGKVQRQACRQLVESKEIFVRYQWSRSMAIDDDTVAALPLLPQREDGQTIDDAAAQIEAWLLAWLVARGRVDENEVANETPFADYGLDSLAAVELSSELEDWLGIELTPVLAWNYPTPARLAIFLAEELVGKPDEAEESELDEEDDFEKLLAEIENMPDE